MEFNTIKQTSNWGNASSLINDNFQKTSVEIESLKASLKYFKGYFLSGESLSSLFPSPRAGDYAYVGSAYPGTVYSCTAPGVWQDTGVVPDSPAVDMGDYAKKEDTDTLRGQLSNTSSILGRFVSMINPVSEPGFHFPDSSGKDVMNYTEAGFDAAKVTAHFISLVLSSGVITEDMLSEDVKSMLGTLNLGESSGTAYAGDKGKANADAILKLEASLKSFAKLLEAVFSMQKVKEDGFHVTDSSGKDVMNYTDAGFDAAKVTAHFLSLVLSENVITETMLSKGVRDSISLLRPLARLVNNIMQVKEGGFHVADASGKDVMNYTEAGLDAARVSAHFVRVLNDAGVRGSLEYDIVDNTVYNF